MTFISWQFAVFFIVNFCLYFSLPHRWRWVLLLVSSYYFYGYWNASYLILIFFTTTIDYIAGRAIGESPPDALRRRRLFLFLSLGTNLATLAIFKYFNFFNASLDGLFTSFGWSYPIGALDVLLPVGISFYTFQSMAYTIDVYRGMPPEKHFGIFTTFVAFFPQLVAGPIERAPNLLPQFHETHRFNYAATVEGLQYILWGAFKKMVIADRLSIYVNAVYNNTTQHSGLTLIVATVFFAFQIYCDFSGYSDIAIGTAKILGFRLMENFRQPYLAFSIRDFWRRWHISLSTWFKDYLYIPLGGSRRGFSRTLLNMMIVFVVSGLWHGANWTFVIWGFLHGLYIVVEMILARVNPFPFKLPVLIRGTITFVLVLFAWIFFRANTFGDAGYVLSHLLDFSQGLSGLTAPFENGVFRPNIEFALSVGLIGFLMFADWAISRTEGGLNAILSRRPQTLRWATYYALAAGVLIAVFYSGLGQSFIYFQF